MANPILGMALAVPVTALYGALNALLTLGLAMNVSRVRGKHQVFRGDAGNAEIQSAVRAHGNNVEHVPMTLILLLLAELCGGASVALHIFGGALLVARLSHSVGLLRGIQPVQITGALSTYLIELSLAVYVLVLRPWG